MADLGPTKVYGDLQVTGDITGTVKGNADTASKLRTARTIGGVAFDGTANINLPGVNAAGNQNTSGNAATATKLATPRTINGVNFDGSANITVEDSTKLPLAGGNLTGVLHLIDGTVALPGLAFGADTDTGVYRNGTNGIGITTGGTAAAVFDSVGNTTVYGRLRSAGNLSLSSWTTTGCGLDIAAATFTDTTSADAAVIATRASSTFNTPTFASTNAVTVTNAATVFISAPPTAGLNTTLTNRYSLWVNSGASYFGGAITVNGVITGNGSGLTTLNAANLTSGIVPDARLSGTYTGVSITGNAATATKLATARTINGVAFDGTANITVADGTKLPLAGGKMTGTLITKITDHSVGFGGGDGSLSVRGDASSAAVMTFHRDGAYAINLGLDTDNVFRLGGWSNGANVYRFQVDGSGNFTANGNVTAYSDIRLKKDIRVIPDALAKVEQLSGVTYERIDSGERQTGLIAQEVQKVLPEAVSGDDMLSVAYGNLVGLLVEAIKELKAEVDELKLKVAA